VKLLHPSIRPAALDETAHLLRHLLVEAGSVFRASAIHEAARTQAIPGQTGHPLGVTFADGG